MASSNSSLLKSAACRRGCTCWQWAQLVCECIFVLSLPVEEEERKIGREPLPFWGGGGGDLLRLGRMRSSSSRRRAVTSFVSLSSLPAMIVTRRAWSADMLLISFWLLVSTSSFMLRHPDLGSHPYPKSAYDVESHQVQCCDTLSTSAAHCSVPARHRESICSAMYQSLRQHQDDTEEDICDKSFPKHGLACPRQPKQPRFLCDQLPINAALHTLSCSEHDYLSVCNLAGKFSWPCLPAFCLENRRFKVAALT